MTRICVLLIMLGLCAACVDNPYINPVKTDKGTTIAATFSYGKFCGANTPILQRRDPETGKSIFTELRTLWPPADDLDAACYAHDYCELQAYQESFGRQVFASMRTLCDQALVRTLADVNQDFADPSCFNLAHDMTAGMYLRDTPNRPDLWGGAAVFAGLSRVFRKARATTDDYPEEGNCNLVSRSNPELVLDMYEYYFDKVRASHGNNDLAIPRLSDSERMIQVRDRVIRIPLPDEFAVLTPQMSPHYEILNSFTPVTNVTYVTLIPAQKAAALAVSDQVRLPRYLTVSSQKQGWGTATVSPEKFLELRQALRSQFDQLHAEFEEEVGKDPAVDLVAHEPLPIHLDTEHAIAFSSLETVGGGADDEGATTQVRATTTTFLRVGDKLLYLNVFGPESDLDWTRELSEKWAAEIVAANPRPAGE